MYTAYVINFPREKGKRGGERGAYILRKRYRFDRTPILKTFLMGLFLHILVKRKWKINFTEIFPPYSHSLYRETIYGMFIHVTNERLFNLLDFEFLTIEINISWAPLSFYDLFSNYVFLLVISMTTFHLLFQS